MRTNSGQSNSKENLDVGQLGMEDTRDKLLLRFAADDDTCESGAQKENTEGSEHDSTGSSVDPIGTESHVGTSVDQLTDTCIKGKEAIGRSKEGTQTAESCGESSNEHEYSIQHDAEKHTFNSDFDGTQDVENNKTILTESLMKGLERNSKPPADGLWSRSLDSQQRLDAERKREAKEGIKHPPDSFLTDSENTRTHSSSIQRRYSIGWARYGSTQSSKPINSSDAEDKADSQEESLSFCRLSSRHKLTFCSIAFANFCSSAAFAILSPFFPQEAAAKGASQTVTGLIFGAYELVIFLSAPFLGNFLTRVGAKFMFVSGALVSGVCGALFGVLEHSPDGTIYIVMCFLTRTIEALGSSALLVASFAIVAHEFPGNVATVFGALETFSGLGMMVGPPLGGALYQLGGFGLPFFSLGGLLIVCGFACVILMPIQNHRDKPMEGSVISLLLKPSALVVTMSIVTGSVALGFLDPTLAGHLANFDLSPFLVGLMFFLAPAVYAITAPIWGWIGDKKGYVISMIVAGNLLSAVCFLLLGPAPFLNLPLELWLVILSLVLMGLFLGCALIPTFKALIDSASANGFPESFETYGIVSGLFNSAFSFGAFLGPTSLGGIVNDKLGFPWASSICALLFLIVGFVVMVQHAVSQRYCSKMVEHVDGKEKSSGKSGKGS